MSAVRVPVLMYHRIGKAHNAWEAKYCISPENFSARMKALANAGHRAVTLTDFFAWLDGEEDLAEGGFLLTFDDGFLSLLSAHGFLVKLFGRDTITAPPSSL